MITVDINWFAIANIDLHFQMITVHITKRMDPAIFPREKNEKDAAAWENVTFGCGFFIVTLKFWCHPK